MLHFGIPQHRERVIILSKRKDLGELPERPNIPKIRKDNCSITDIIESIPESKYRISEKLMATKNIWNTFICLLENNNISIPRFPIWTDWRDEDMKIIDKKRSELYDKYRNWIDKNRKFYNDCKEFLESWLLVSRENELWIGAVRKLEWQAGDNDNMNTVLWTPRPSGIRTKKLNYSPTLTAMTNIPIYGPDSRHLTPRELCRLQSFPDNFDFGINDKIAYKHLGNAVNVKMVEKCAKFLLYEEPLELNGV